MFLVKKTEPTASLCFEKTINFVKLIEIERNIRQGLDTI